MEKPPADKGPVGPMPKATNPPNDIDITDNLPLFASATSQREINIVAKPCGQRDMPSTPELRNTTREIREVEVAHQMKTKKP